MRIAQVATLNFSVPPKLYGGIERVVSYLTEELVAQGHDVTLFASGDSETTAHLIPVCPHELQLVDNHEDRMRHYMRMMQLVFADVSRFDIIHFHMESIQLLWLRRQPCPNVTTVHYQLGAPCLKTFCDDYNPPWVSISNNQRLPLPNANWQATVYHGVPRNLFTFRNEPGDYLAFLGRASYEKRLDRAIRIASQAGMKLKVAAKINRDDEHFKRDIEPLLPEAGEVEFVGQVGGREKDEFLGNAHALLFPIDWPEPFGLVMIESLACGTPVIAWRNGSVPEVIDDGRTGFIVESIEEAVKAVGRISDLDRRTCRQTFEDRFDAAGMARQYVEVYRRLVEAGH